MISHRVVERLVRRAAGSFFARRSLRKPGVLAIPTCSDHDLRAVYLHVPFCEKLCPFCSFNSVAFEHEAGQEYFGVLREEMALYHGLGYRFDVVHVGGGTPTVLPGEVVRTVERARSLWPVREVSVETNPNHLTESTLRALRDVGVQRLSVGVQSFDDGMLERLGRLEAYGTGSQIRATLEKAAAKGIALSVDLIFDIPGQTPEILRRDIESVRSLPVDQVTFYPLMTRDRHAAGAARMFDMVRAGLNGAFAQTTAWSFARRPGLVDEYIAERDEFAGLGAGAFGMLDGRLTTNAFPLRSYIDAVRRGRLPVVDVRTLGSRDLKRYVLLMRVFSATAYPRSLGQQHSVREHRMLRLLGVFRRVGARNEITDRGRTMAMLAMRAFFESVEDWRRACRDLIPA
jgi:coproporphyrinogen III oxidase-like Fe-S oxidoreductase